LAALTFSAYYGAVRDALDGAAVVLATLLLEAVKLLGCLVVGLAYGPTVQAEGHMAMSWDGPNFLLWFCLAGGLLCSAVLGAVGFR
jgi:hypothetical protein